MFHTRSIDMKKNRCLLGQIVLVMLALCRSGYAWFWMEDPLYGSSYDTSRVAFPKLPPEVVATCPALDGSVSSWSYGAASTDSATYYIVNRAFSRIPGETDLVEADRGLLLMADKSGCRATSLAPAFNGSPKRTATLPDSFVITESVVASLSRSIHTHYTKAFGGFDRYKRQIRMDLRDKSDLPSIYWQILDSMIASGRQESKDVPTRPAKNRSKPTKLSMYEPVFAADFDPRKVRFESVGRDLRLGCEGLPKGLPWWIFARASMEPHGEALILSGLREIVPDGPSNDLPVLEPDFGVVALIYGGKCDLVHIDNGLSRKRGDVENDTRFPLPDSTMDALAKDLVQRYLAAFGGKRSLFLALGKDSLGGTFRPAQFGRALRNLQEP